MDGKLVVAIVAAAVGSFLTFAANWILAERKRQADAILAERKRQADASLQTRVEVQSFLAETLNREAPDQIADSVEEYRRKWARLNRTLYLLNVPEEHRTAIDSAMENYLDSVQQLKWDPYRRDLVEKQRELAKEEALRLMGRL